MKQTGTQKQPIGEEAVKMGMPVVEVFAKGVNDHDDAFGKLQGVSHKLHQTFLGHPTKLLQIAIHPQRKIKQNEG